MKSVILIGETTVKTNIGAINVEEDKLTLALESGGDLILEKKHFPEASYMSIANKLKSINVTSSGIFTINMHAGSISLNQTGDADKLFDSEKPSNMEAQVKTQPLIDGVFTQTPQGAISNINKDVIEKFKSSKNVN
jgi:hypothetical protein